MADSDHLPSNSYIPEGRGLGRPVDRRQESYEPSGHASRAIPPHGDVSQDGTRVWPQPTMTSRVLVYGGAAIAAAAATAGVVLAARKVADMVTGNDELDREADDQADRARSRVYDEARGRGSRLMAMPEREREAMRDRARARMRADEAERSRLRSEARRNHDDSHRPRRKAAPSRARGASKPLGFLDDVEDTAQRLTQTVNNVVSSIGGAVAAFRSVASQAEGVMRDFHQAADQVRGFLDTGRGAGSAPFRDPYRRPSRRDMVDLRDSGDETGGQTGGQSGHQQGDQSGAQGTGNSRVGGLTGTDTDLSDAPGRTHRL